MNFSSISDFKNALVDYLEREKQFAREDIETNQSLPDAEKIEKGLLVEHASVLRSMPPFYDLEVSENNTKLRPGDYVELQNGNTKLSAKVIENTSDIISLECSTPLKDGDTFRLEVKELVMLQSIINLAKTIDEYCTGAFWMEILAGIEYPDKEGISTIPRHKNISNLNDCQNNAINSALKRPSYFCIQGPPGTGKTSVLSMIAASYASDPSTAHPVLILSHSHQAVNNALNKVKKDYPNLNVTKVGDLLKAEGLDVSVSISENYNSYLRSRNKRKFADRDIVGMTYHAAVVNLGLRNTSFNPHVAIIDEAGQMPFVYGALIGMFGCSTNIFIGDDRQMPPIFHEKLIGNPFSQSIFSYLCEQNPSFREVLTTTYRMNDEITEFINKHFYNPHGIALCSSNYSAARRLEMPVFSSDERISAILSSPKSIHRLDVSSNSDWEDFNGEEAEFISDLILEALNEGLAHKDIAVITPYRRQVKTIREYVATKLKNSRQSNIPLIDTVERLQGQEVEMVIISLSITSPDFWIQQRDFVLNPNRLNVMVSRARTKVVILGKYTD